MEDFLRRYGAQITAVFAHNDDMGLGAIQAIEEYGLKPGVDIQIVSVDSIRDAFQAMADGKLNATIECNPLLGPQFYDLALKVVNGEPVPKWVPSKESVFLVGHGAGDPAHAQILKVFAHLRRWSSTNTGQPKNLTQRRKKLHCPALSGRHTLPPTLAPVIEGGDL